ncbi:MAG: cob(I)yrinic acid a,c-diamide adenosyltransferase [Bacteroidota bacterium]|nr:cob(I)yrinic acid a,c-diamide adenosyltransferase [Bacteroidota bacterium]
MIIFSSLEEGNIKLHIVIRVPYDLKLLINKHMKIYTRTGDKGITKIFGNMSCKKDDIRIECNGKLDEANSFIGLLRSNLGKNHEWQNGLFKIQTDIMDIMSHIATHSSKRKLNKVAQPKDGEKFCEHWIDEMLNEMPEPHDWFILPGGNEVSALCHVVRTTLRTAERRLFTLNNEDPVEVFILKYINRLSDLFFVLSRYELFKAQLSEEKLRSFRRIKK